MNFSEALLKAKEGLPLIRRDWDPAKYLTIMTGAGGNPILASTETRVEVFAWLPLSDDLFADDWEVVENG